MSTEHMTDEQLRHDLMARVRRIYRAILTEPLPSPEEQARQYNACLVAAAGIRLKVGGWRPWSEGGDELARDMALAAGDAMDAVVNRAVAARN